MIEKLDSKYRIEYTVHGDSGMDAPTTHVHTSNYLNELVALGQLWRYANNTATIRREELLDIVNGALHAGRDYEIQGANDARLRIGLVNRWVDG